MLAEKYTKGKSEFCDTPELIENYELATIDPYHMYVCHHRDETDFGCTSQYLKDTGHYFHLPPDKLIFLPEDVHSKAHTQSKRTGTPYGVPNKTSADKLKIYTLAEKAAKEILESASQNKEFNERLMSLDKKFKDKKKQDALERKRRLEKLKFKDTSENNDAISKLHSHLKILNEIDYEYLTRGLDEIVF